MNYLSTLFFIYLAHYVSCAPVKQTFYDAILEKCPNLLPTSKDSQIFKTCQDWEVIKTVNKMSGNEREIRCLFYFEAFTQYCTNTQIPNTTVSDLILSQYTIDSICDYAKNISHKNLSILFSNKNNCKQICSDDSGYANTMCQLSLHFFNIKSDANKHGQKADALNNTNNAASKITSEHPNNDMSSGAQNVQLVPKDTNANKHIALLHNLPQDPFKDSKVNPGPVPNADNVLVPVSDQTVKKSDDIDTRKDTSATDSSPITVQRNNQQDEKIESKVDMDTQVATEQHPEKTVESPSEHPENETPAVQHSENVDQDKSNQKEQGSPDQEMGDEDDQQPDMPDDDAMNPALPNEKESKPLQTDESDPVNYSTEMEGDSYFFTYFMLLCIIFVVGYVCYHNKQKILALFLEGRKGKRQYRGRRPNSANYHKLDSNLEEAITSSCKKNTNNVIY